uniref:CD24 molecule n=1 Tax=Panthera tigris altaica TaxID=74533 RepID=A0A8C9JV66_PANTA
AARARRARVGTGVSPPLSIYSNQTTVVTLSSNPSQNTSTAPNTANATTTTATGGALQSTASLFVISLSLLHLYC